jgi:hypothetical protein
MNNIRLAVRALVFTLAVALFSGDATAQYFGRNKVQWENFNFKVLRTEHFDIYYYEESEEVVADVGRIAERWYERLSRVFEHQFTRKPFVLYANHADFQQTTTTTGMIGEGTGGFTDAFQNRMVLPLTGNWADNDHVIGHELVHVFQFDIANTSSTGGMNQRRMNLSALPLWLVEGMAEYLTKGRIDPLTAMWIRDATANDRLPTLRNLTRDPRYFPYRYGQALLAYVGGRYGDQAVVNLFLAAGMYGVDQAFSRALGVPHQQIFEQWHAAARELYEPVFLRRPDALGSPLIGGRDSRSALNIGPTLSPDGTKVAFLSTRELFTIDLFVADAATGRIQRNVLSSASNPHFDALRFIDSAGSWSPDGRRLAAVVVERGDNRIAIIDAERGGIERRIKVPGVEALSNPAWSPDGRWMAFSAQARGVSDIVIYNMETEEVRYLTKDPYSDLQPVWSPDGRTITFTTDRGQGTDLALLQYSDLRLATVDVASGRVDILPLFPDAKHINPQYGPDGSVYFIANPDGIPNVYRYNAATGVARMTNVSTGIAGITQLSPALAVAVRGGNMVFSVFENDNYNLYSLPANAPAEPASTAAQPGIRRAAVLPPLTSTGPSVTGYLLRPEEGLPPQNASFPVTNYRPNLRLTYLGPPALGVGVGTGGEFGVGGSLSALFSDVLGEHMVGVTFQGGSSTGGFGTLFGGEAFYLNRQNRINWGGAVTHIPYVSAAARAYNDVIIVNGQPTAATIYEELRREETFDELSAITMYPFSRTRRLEANVGYQYISFDNELRRQVYVGGRLVDDDVIGLPSPGSIGIARAALAFVGDSSYFGFISPVRGTRYRFEAETLSGDLDFQTGLADYRRYFFMRPMTFAVRGLHYGRYGSGSEDPRISPLYLGRSTLVRGYEAGSISADECDTPAGTDLCPVYDRLLGSKLAMFSTELRVPLFGTREYGLINAPALPVELVGFVDGGVAWTEDQDPELRWDTGSRDRVPVFSAGVAARILLAYIPIEIYYAKPFQRPQQGWEFGFAIKPGW